MPTQKSSNVKLWKQMGMPHLYQPSFGELTQPWQQILITVGRMRANEGQCFLAIGLLDVAQERSCSILRSTIGAVACNAAGIRLLTIPAKHNDISSAPSGQTEVFWSSNMQHAVVDICASTVCMQPLTLVHSVIPSHLPCARGCKDSKELVL